MQKKFEVAIYNQQVRDCVALGEPHRDYTDDWADIHYIEIRARSHNDAALLAAKRYPAEKGFVIGDVEEVREFF